MSVTWGDLKNVTWGEMHKAGMTWGDAKTLTSREYFELLEKRLCALETQMRSIPEERRKLPSIATVCAAVSLAIALVQLGFDIDKTINPAITREDVVSIVQNVEIIADAAQSFLEEPQQESLNEPDHDIDEERPK